jgi:endonuclease YncB( thermonuclease family)
MHEKLYYYRVTGVVSVFDGDTTTLQVSLGRHLKDRWPCRLARINTPEIRSPVLELQAKAYAARDYLRGRLEAAVTSGTLIVIHSIKLEKYGRALVELYIGETNINDEMLELGLAEPYADAD